MRIKILLLVLPFFAFASEHGGVNYDIIERALNFLLFFGILLYFIAKPLKDLYQSRIDKIAGKLESIQEKLRASKLKKDDALKRVEEAKLNASSLVETARKEAVNLAQKVKKTPSLRWQISKRALKIKKTSRSARLQKMS